MREREEREGGTMAVVAAVLLVAITVALAAVLAIQDPAGFKRNLEKTSKEPPPDTGLYATHDDAYMLEPLGPDAIPFIGSKLIVTADGVTTSYNVAQLAPQLPAGATSWKVGQSVCIAGGLPNCLRPAANVVAVEVVSQDSVIADLPALPSLG